MPTAEPGTPPPRHADREQSLQEELLDEMFTENNDDQQSPNEEQVTRETVVDDEESEAALQAEPDAIEEQTPPADEFTQQRFELQRRLASSTRLPPVVRNRLSELVEQAAWNEAGEEQPTLSIGQAVAWLEGALPRQFSLDAEALEPSEHPAGDAFFSGRPEELNDQQAADLAAQQLAATGYASRDVGIPADVVRTDQPQPTR